jgi:hypothetical protein
MNIINKIPKTKKDKKLLKEIKEYFIKNGIDFYFSYMTIKKNVISEYGYLLNYVSNGEVKTFDDLDKVFLENKEIILKNIDDELSKAVLVEGAYYNISNESARTNMEDLKTIILTISNLKEYAKTLNLNLDEILEIYKNKEIKDETKN